MLNLPSPQIDPLILAIVPLGESVGGISATRPIISSFATIACAVPSPAPPRRGVRTHVRRDARRSSSAT